jgi:hypothetical protein
MMECITERTGTINCTTVVNYAEILTATMAMYWTPQRSSKNVRHGYKTVHFIYCPVSHSNLQKTITSFCPIMYKSESMKGLPCESWLEMGIVYFGGSTHLLHLRSFRIIWSCILQIAYKKNRVCHDDVETITVQSW